MSEYNQEYYDEVEFKEISRQKKVRKKKHYLLRFLIFMGIIVCLGLFFSSSIFDIKEIKVEGNRYYEDEQVISMAGVRTGVNLFRGEGVSDIVDKLEKNPYYAEAKISRKLPDRLIIKVKERQQIAAFTYGENFVVIDKHGIVLRKSGVDPKLTLLKGLTISKLNVGEAIEAEEAATLEVTLKMLDTMQDGDIFFKKIDVSKVVIKAYIYDTLVVKGTPKQMLKSIENGDLQKVVNNLFKNNTTRGTINLGDHNYMAFSPEF